MIDLSVEEVEYYKELSMRLNCFVAIEKDGQRMEFWGPYYNQALGFPYHKKEDSTDKPGKEVPY